MSETTNTQTEDTANQNTGDTSTDTNEGEKLFTQDEVNKIVAKRRSEERRVGKEC